MLVGSFRVCQLGVLKVRFLVEPNKNWRTKNSWMVMGVQCPAPTQVDLSTMGS